MCVRWAVPAEEAAFQGPAILGAPRLFQDLIPIILFFKFNIEFVCHVKMMYGVLIFKFNIMFSMYLYYIIIIINNNKLLTLLMIKYNIHTKGNQLKMFGMSVLLFIMLYSVLSVTRITRGKKI